MRTQTGKSLISIEQKSVIKTVGRKKIRYLIWDTDSYKGDQNIRQVYYSKTNAIFIVFNISNRKCYKETECWLSLVRSYQKIIILVGIQIQPEKREVSDDEIRAFSSMHGIRYYEIKIADITSVDKAFIDVAC